MLWTLDEMVQVMSFAVIYLNYLNNSTVNSFNSENY